MGLLELSSFRFTTVKNLNSRFWNSEGQHRKWMHKFSGQSRPECFPKAKEEMNVLKMIKKWVHVDMPGSES